MSNAFVLDWHTHDLKMANQLLQWAEACFVSLDKMLVPGPVLMLVPYDEHRPYFVLRSVQAGSNAQEQIVDTEQVCLHTLLSSLYCLF